VPLSTQVNKWVPGNVVTKRHWIGSVIDQLSYSEIPSTQKFPVRIWLNPENAGHYFRAFGDLYQ